MSDKEIALVSHLMRRAGFGATRTEIEELSEKSYEDIVETCSTRRGPKTSKRMC